MANIIRTMEKQKIINQSNPIKNKALEVLLDFDMPEDLVAVFNNTLYFVSNEDTQVAIEVKDNDIKEIDVINDNDKYIVINNSEDETIGIKFEGNTSKPFFTAHYCSLNNDIDTKYYDYLYFVIGNVNLFDFKQREKGKVKALAK